KFLIPLHEFDMNSIPDYYEDSDVIKYLEKLYHPYETVQSYHSSRFYDPTNEPIEITRRKSTDFVRHIRMIDGVELIYTLLIIISKYKAVLEDNKFDMSTKVGYRVRVTNTWRKF